MPLLQVTADPHDDHYCAFSPDGRHFVWGSDRNADSEDEFDLFIVKDWWGCTQEPEGCDAQALQLTDAPGRDGSPVFSPNGDFVAINSNRDGDWDIFAFPLGGDCGSVPTGCDEVTFQVTDHPGLDVFPDWAPNGRTIVFGSDRSGNFDIFGVGITLGSGGQVTIGSPFEIISGPDGDAMPRVSPIEYSGLE